jgi:hypothetical protein
MLPSVAEATVSLDGNAFYFTDTYSTSSSSTYSRLFWDAALSINLTKKGGTMIGWAYASSTFTDNANGQSQTVVASGMGPKLTFYLDKENLWSFSFTYLLLLTGTDSSQSGVSYEGTGMKAEFGYVTPISDTIFLGAKINYFSASFSKQITNQTSLSQVSYGRTAIYPSVAFMLRFD